MEGAPRAAVLSIAALGPHLRRPRIRARDPWGVGGGDLRHGGNILGGLGLGQRGVVRLDLPDDAGLCVEPRLEDLPKGWSDLPSSPVAAAFGDAFLAKGNRLGLIVPSAITPEASNILINPSHPRMSDVTMEILREFTFDPRLRR